MGRATGTLARSVEGAPGREAAAIRSLLLIDCGTAFTKAALIGLVEDRHRLLATSRVGTTSTPPYADITRGLVLACDELERRTGRTLLRGGKVLTPEQDDGAGVDAVALATSVGGPLCLLTAGPGREALSALLHRSIGGLFVQPEPLPAAPSTAHEGDPQWQQLVAQVSAQHPHAILIVGAPSGGIRAMGTITEHAQAVARWLEALRLAAQAPPAPGEDSPPRPGALPVVFTGNTEEAMTVASTIRANTAMVHSVESLTPTSLAPLNRAIGALYENVVLHEVPGYSKLRSVTATPPIAALTSLGGVVRFLSQQYGMNVVGVDVGANATMLAASTAQGEFLPAALPLGGVGVGAGHVLRAAGPANLLRWLTTPADENSLREYALTRRLRPRTIPTSPVELELEYAFAREAIRLAQLAPGARLAGLHPIDVLLGTGGVLANVPHPALALLILLDALQPRGITSVVLDVAGLAPMLGAAAQFAPELAAGVTESDALPLLLGSAISVAGTPTAGQPAVRVVLEREDGGRQTEEVPYGALVRLPLAPGERALLSLYPSEAMDVGLGQGQQARASEPIEGGTLGLVVDARGRPLTLPAAPAERIALLAEWRRALGIADVGPAGREAGYP